MEPRSRDQVELHRRLVWLTLFRLAVVLVLFASSIIWSNGAEVPPSLSLALFGVCAGGFIATLAFSLLLRTTRWLLPVAYGQITFDTLLAAALVYLTGGSNAFSFVFILAVVNAALVLSQRGAIVAASLSSLLFAALRVSLNERWLPPAAAFQLAPREPSASILFTVFVNLGAFFLMAAAASYLADQIRKKTEQLTARELDFSALAELHSAILASISSGIATADPEGTVIFVNRAGWEICAAWCEKQAGINASTLFPGLELPGRNSDVARQEIEIDSPAGSRWLGLTVSALHGGGAFAGGHVIVFQDLTDLRRLELDARRNEKLASLGKLAAGLAHELRNPLASMSGAVQMIAQGHSADTDERRLGEIVVSETDRLNRLVSDFLTFARPTPKQSMRVDLGDLVAETLEIVTHGPHFGTLKVERSLSHAAVMADGAQLRQAVWNLLVNAAEAMNGVGILTVSVESIGDKGVIQIDDTGPGIRAADLSQIFDPFFTTKPAGTGLGLATVHSVIEAHAGMVTAENRERGGARFIIRLPLVASSTPATSSAERVLEEGTF